MAASAVLFVRRNKLASRGTKKHSVARRRQRLSYDGESPAWQKRPDLFLQLPFLDASGCTAGVRLSGVLSGSPTWPQLPAAPQTVKQLPPLMLLPAHASQQMPPLAIVFVRSEGGAACVRYEAKEPSPTKELKDQLGPGPLRPETASGRALSWVLRNSPERFALARDYELLRASLAPEGRQRDSEAELLVLGTYARLLESAGAPARPAAAPGGDEASFHAYVNAFGSAAMRALEHTASQDFQLVAKAHVIGLVNDASFPRLLLENARAMYKNAACFGHALRQAEIRFQAEGAAGTFVPAALEAQLQRERLEKIWARTPLEDGCSGAEPGPPLSGWPGGASEGPAPNVDMGHRSLQEVSSLLQRVGQARPGLATYLGWLGRFDADALSLLATPSPTVAMAIQMQVSAVWGEVGGVSEEEASSIVATTPSDMVEAILFGAWLCDAAVEVEDSIGRHCHGTFGEA